MGFFGSTAQHWGGLTSCDTRVGMFPLTEYCLTQTEQLATRTDNPIISFLSQCLEISEGGGGEGNKIKIEELGCRFTLIYLLLPVS